MRVANHLSDVYNTIARRLAVGKVVPVLGAGANLCERPPEACWTRGKYLPSGSELATELARYLDFSLPEGSDLARVSQYVSALEGEGALYEELHEVFDADYPPTTLHRFLVELARLDRADTARQCMLFITTNYDDALERAFDVARAPYDMLAYIAEGRDRGLFRYIPFNGPPVVIRVPNEFADIRLDERPVIAKMHGAIDRLSGDDSYVITEDDYIDYISRADVGLFPATIAAKIRRSHLLFLGYSLRDWNVRAMLHRLWDEQQGRTYKSWAVDASPDPLDQAAWDARGVEILPVRLEEFIVGLRERLEPRQGPGHEQA